MKNALVETAKNGRSNWGAPFIFIPGTVIVAVLALLIAVTGCRRPDGASPEEDFCSSGPPVNSVNDQGIPAEVKNAIYGRPAGYIGVGHPDYNPNLPLVIIPYEFATLFPFNVSVTTNIIRSNFFSTGTGSVKDYFYENSWGQYNIREGFIANGVHLPQDTAFYANGQEGRDWTRNPEVVRLICQNSNVDWASLDVNGNHIIEPSEAMICFMAAIGLGGASRPASVTISTNSGNYTINNRFTFFDCKRNDDLSRGVADISYNFPTIWHELCHGMFGLPDRYSCAFKQGCLCGSGKVGQYDIMSNNCARIHMTIYDKMKIGWIRPRILGTGVPSQCYRFEASSTDSSALIVLPPTYVASGREYWIIENRFKDASPRNFDQGLPESGLAIWYVNEETDQIALVDARSPGTNPTDIEYNPYALQTGALFQYDSTAPVSERVLVSQHRILRIISYVSRPGNTMFINL